MGNQIKFVYNRFPILKAEVCNQGAIIKDGSFFQESFLIFGLNHGFLTAGDPSAVKVHGEGLHRSPWRS